MLPDTREALIDLIRRTGTHRTGAPGRWLSAGYRPSRYIDFTSGQEQYHAEYAPPARCAMLRSLGSRARWQIWCGPSSARTGKAFDPILELADLDLFPTLKVYASDPL